MEGLLKELLIDSSVLHMDQMNGTLISCDIPFIQIRLARLLCFTPQGLKIKNVYIATVTVNAWWYM